MSLNGALKQLSESGYNNHKILDDIVYIPIYENEKTSSGLGIKYISKTSKNKEEVIFYAVAKNGDKYEVIKTKCNDFSNETLEEIVKTIKVAEKKVGISESHSVKLPKIGDYNGSSDSESSTSEGSNDAPKEQYLTPTNTERLPTEVYVPGENESIVLDEEENNRYTPFFKLLLKVNMICY